MQRLNEFPIQRIELEQGSPEWHAWRSTVGGASYAGAVLGISPHYPHNPAELYDVMTGRSQVYVNAAMRRGTAMEAEVRRRNEAAMGGEFPPACFQRWRLGASLDGLRGKSGMEIKMPAKGVDSDLYKSATSGAVPEYIMAQIQQQMWVAWLSGVMLIVGTDDPKTDVRIGVLPDDEWQSRILAAWMDYWQYYDNFTRPPLHDARSDYAWLAAAAEWREAKAAAKEAETREAAAREALIALAGDAESARGGGVRAVRVETAGSVDYQRAIKALAPAMTPAALEEYRKPGRISYRITEAEEIEQ